MRRRTALALPVALLPAARPRAAPWLDRPVRVVVPYPAGGWADAGARIVFGRLAQRTGQQFVIENRSGAGGMVGSTAVAGSSPDGSVILYGASSLTVAPSLYARLNFLPMSDLMPVGMVVRGPLLLIANKERPERTVQDVIATAKRSPGGLDWASGGIGTTPHLTAALFARAAGIPVNHITYRGGAPALNDVIAGQVGFLFSTSAVSVRQVQQGTVLGIAHTATAPLAELPELPAVSATLPGFEAHDWYAVFTPAGTAPGLVAELSAALRAVLGEPDIRQQMTQPGATVGGGGPEELAARMEAETRKWGEVIREAGIQPG